MEAVRKTEHQPGFTPDGVELAHAADERRHFGHKRKLMIAGAALLAISMNSSTFADNEHVASDSTRIVIGEDNSIVAADDDLRIIIETSPNLVAESFIRPPAAIDVYAEPEEPKPAEETPKEEPSKPPAPKKEEPPKPAEPKKEPPKPPAPEKPKELSNIEAARAFSKSNHKYAQCGAIVVRFMEEGYSYEQSVGAAANSAVEAWDAKEGTGCNPEIKQHQGNAEGIFQWDNRLPDLKAYAKSKGVSHLGMDIQLKFAFHELNTTESYAKKEFKKTDSIPNATEVFCKKFERPGVPHLDRRKAAGQDINDQIMAHKKG